MVRVAPGRPDQQGYHHAGEDAAEHQVVDGVRQRVGVVVRVAEVGDADRVRQHQGAQKSGAPRHQGANRHAGAGPDQAGSRACALPGPSGRADAGRRRAGPGPAGPARAGRKVRRPVPGLRVPGPQVIGGPGAGRRRAGRRRAGRPGPGLPGHAAPAGGRGRRARRVGGARLAGRGEPGGPQRPGGWSGPAQGQRQRGLGRAGAARHRALERRQRIGVGGVPPAPRLVGPRLWPVRIAPARLRRRRPGVVPRPGHPEPPSGVARWCQCRRYPVGQHLRRPHGTLRAASAGSPGRPR